MLENNEFQSNSVGNSHHIAVGDNSLLLYHSDPCPFSLPCSVPGKDDSSSLHQLGPLVSCLLFGLVNGRH